MTDKPEIIIEEYLALVNEHLPESISEDVITELRSYMVETARENGGGEITQQSAKKVVAHFGAPSEVAREYKYSMLPETIPQDEAASVALPDKIEEPESRKRETTTYFGAFLQAGAITIGWTLIIALLSTILGPIWIEGMVTMILVSQVVVVLVSVGVTTYSRIRNSETLLTRSYPEWPRMQKLLTLPDNYINDSAERFPILDILGSFVGFTIFFASISSFTSPWYFLIIGVPSCILFLSKMIIGVIRKKSLDPTKRLHSEFLVTFGSLLFLDCSLIWLVFRWMSTYNPWSPYVWIYAIAWGPVLLFQLVVRGQNLYWDRTDSKKTEVSLRNQETEEMLKRVGTNRNSTIARIGGWIVAFCTIPVYCTIIFYGTQSLSHSNSIVSLTMFLSPIYIIPAVIYFLFRRFAISRGKASTVFGERSRPEAIVDFVISSMVFISFASIFFSYLLSSSNLMSMYHIARDDLGFDGARYFILGFVGFYLLVVTSLGFRIIGDILEFWKPKKDAASELITTSSSLLVIAISLKVGIDIFSYNFGIFPMSIYPVVLLFVVLIAFQTETTRLKIREKKRMSKVKTAISSKPRMATSEYSKNKIDSLGSNYPSS
ncbi:MAG: hypothetical protein RTV41_05765 [Candidatus Thorarchaeota archaeon]